MAQNTTPVDRATGPSPSGVGGAARHLAAILAADVAGYSRLMGADEEGTLERLKAHRRELIDPSIAQHKGRIVKTTGDGALVEFPSVVDAVRCAVEIQRAMVDRNADTPADRRITFRIGINLGDVIADGGDIYGDGVNIAARLEAIAEPGGICISRVVWDQIRDRLPYTFEDLGEQSVKNIARPVSAYALGADAIASMVVAPRAQAQPSATRHSISRPLLTAASIFVVIGLAAGTWWAWPHSGSQQALVPAPPVANEHRTVESSAVTKVQAASPARLSIVVLPLANLSKDPDQEYFVDAITNDLTTDLSRISDSFVIARNAAFTYKGKAVDAKQISREMGVRYVLEGSVRLIGNQVQVNIQLIDGETGAHVWADRFETDRQNLAVAQSEITGRLARTLHLALVQDAGRRIERERATNPEARDLVMRGWALWYRPFSVANRQEAQQLFERALEIDPSSVDARIGIAMILVSDLNRGSTFRTSPQRDRADQLLMEALALDPNSSMAHAAMGFLRRIEDRQPEAQAEFETALALDRNNAWAISQLGLSYMMAGDPERCIPMVEKALIINPREGDAYTRLGKCHLFLGRVDEALNLFRKGKAATPSVWYVRLKIAGTLGLMGGNLDEAGAEAAEMVKLNPRMNSVARIRDLNTYRNARFQTLHDTTVIQGLRNIGFPEEMAAR